MRRLNEQREYDLRHQTQIEMENRFLYEKLAAAEKEKGKELIALREKQEIEREKKEMEKLLELEKQQAEKLVSEKLLELEKQKIELERQKTVLAAEQQAPGDSRVSETGSSVGSRDQSEEISDKIIFQGKIISDADKQLEMQSVSANKLFLQSENKINSDISSELLFDALLSDNVDVHLLTVDDDVVHSLTAADVVVCSHSIYTRPQLTDSLGAQHTCLPVCTSTTTATTTQPPQQPLLMINDTQPSLLSNFYSQPAPALTAAHQPVTSVPQLTASVHQPVISAQQSATDLHQLFVTAGVQQQSAAIVYTQPTSSATQLLSTQPSTTWLVHTQPTHPQPLTAWTATALPLGTQPPQPS